jgi:predicted nucleic acid-binding protein
VTADEAVKWKAGKTSGSLSTSGDEIDREDGIIGSTVLLYAESVVTRYTAQVNRIDDLDIETD